MAPMTLADYLWWRTPINANAAKKNVLIMQADETRERDAAEVINFQNRARRDTTRPTSIRKRNSRLLFAPAIRERVRDAATELVF
jgi:hypothetical protein